MTHAEAVKDAERAVGAVLAALLVGAFLGLLVGAGCIRKPEERTAYARGYAAAVDSVRSQVGDARRLSATMHPDTVVVFVGPYGPIVRMTWRVR